MDKKVEKKKLIPRDGLKVFNPKTKTFLKKEGEVVNMNPYWRRRVKDKDFKKVEDVVEAKKPAAPKPESKPVPVEQKEKQNLESKK